MAKSKNHTTHNQCKPGSATRAAGLGRLAAAGGGGEGRRGLGWARAALRAALRREVLSDCFVLLGYGSPAFLSLCGGLSLRGKEVDVRRD